MSFVAIARPRPLVLGDLIAMNRGRLAHAVRDVLLVVGAAGFVGALAQLSIHLSFTPVPITGQTLGVLLAGTALGWRRAAASLALYGIAGVAGVPWFAGATSRGYVGATFGYIVGFFFAATSHADAWLKCGADRSVLRSLPAMIVGEIIIYIFGLIWLGFDAHLHTGVSATLTAGIHAVRRWRRDQGRDRRGPAAGGMEAGRCGAAGRTIRRQRSPGSALQ